MKISINRYDNKIFKNSLDYNWYQIFVQGTPFEIEVLEDWWENESSHFGENDTFFGNYTAIFDIKEDSDVALFKLRWL